MLNGAWSKPGGKLTSWVGRTNKFESYVYECEWSTVVPCADTEHQTQLTGYNVHGGSKCERPRQWHRQIYRNEAKLE